MVKASVWTGGVEVEVDSEGVEELSAEGVDSSLSEGDEEEVGVLGEQAASKEIAIAPNISEQGLVFIFSFLRKHCDRHVHR